MTLRIHADFNSCLDDERGTWCWRLRHNGRLLYEVADERGLFDGMPIVIIYKGDADQFEFDAVLGHSADPY